MHVRADETSFPYVTKERIMVKCSVSQEQLVASYEAKHPACRTCNDKHPDVKRDVRTGIQEISGEMRQLRSKLNLVKYFCT